MCRSVKKEINNKKFQNSNDVRICFNTSGVNKWHPRTTLSRKSSRKSGFAANAFDSKYPLRKKSEEVKSCD